VGSDPDWWGPGVVAEFHGHLERGAAVVEVLGEKLVLTSRQRWLVDQGFDLPR